LPVPPGLLTFAWGKVSGPGEVIFSNPSALTTTATFSTPGTYSLRLTVSDGAFSASDDLTVVASGSSAETIHIDEVHYSGGASPSFQIGFTTQSGLTYTVQYRDSLRTGAWTVLTHVPAQSTAQPVVVSDPNTIDSSTRYYRIVSP
jgi:hypothetical protein